MGWYRVPPDSSISLIIFLFSTYNMSQFDHLSCLLFNFYLPALFSKDVLGKEYWTENPVKGQSAEDSIMYNRLKLATHPMSLQVPSSCCLSSFIPYIPVLSLFNKLKKHTVIRVEISCHCCPFRREQYVHSNHWVLIQHSNIWLSSPNCSQMWEPRKIFGCYCMRTVTWAGLGLVKLHMSQK